jgi:hypothetical protein
MQRTWLVNPTPHVCAHRKHASRRVMILSAVIVALIALPALEAHAAPETICDGTIGAVMVEGTIVVPDGATCTLAGTIVSESIRVRIESTLIAQGIEVLKPGTVNIQASGATRIEVTGLRKFVGGVLEDPECTEVRRDPECSELLGGIQAVGGGTVLIADTRLGGGLQILNNSGAVHITESFVEGALELGKNTGGVSVRASFLGEGVEISETTGDVTFIGNTSDESDVTIAKTTGDVTVRDNPNLGENFEVSETSGQVSVLGNTINDNVALSDNAGGALVDGNRVGDNLALSKITGGPVNVLGNTVGDNVELLESGGAVIFAENLIEGSASIDKTTGHVTANNNTLGYVPLPEPGHVPEVAPGGSLLVSEASEGAIVRDNGITGDLEVSENVSATSVSDNTVRGGITVSKNKGGTAVSGNLAGGDIECKDNAPPATGVGNVAGTSGSGSLKGECAELGPLPEPEPAP